MISVCLINLKLQCNNKLWNHRNNTIPISFLLSCSMRTASHSFSRCWVLLSIASLKKFPCWLFQSSKRTKSFVITNKIEDTSFDELSGIVIPEILLNIVFCYDFVQDNKSTLILACRIKLVLYYLYKYFVILEQDSLALKNVPRRVKNVYMLFNVW